VAWRETLLFLVCLAVGQSVLAQPTRAGSEFQVNLYTTNSQFLPSVAMANDGSFVIAWGSAGQDGAFDGVFARRFDAAGSPQGTEFQVNTYTSGRQEDARVGMDSDGDFVVAWESIGQDGGAYGVFARRFASNGSAAGGEFQVNTYTAFAQYHLAVASAANGNFVVAWQSAGQDGSNDGVFARRFTSNGAGVGAEFQVNTYTLSLERTPAIDLESDGDFVIVWRSEQDASGSGITGQRFSSAGARLGPEFGVNAFHTGSQYAPTVGVDDGGSFVVAWAGPMQDGSGYGIFSRRFDSTGAPQGSETQVNSFNTGDQLFPGIATEADGDSVVTWNSALQDGSGTGVFARRFKASGVAQSGDLLVNSYTPLDQSVASVATNGSGEFVVSWSSINQDGSGFGIFAQRFEVAIVIDIDGDGQYLPLTDGLLLLRFGFGFTGATLITGAVGPGCTRCDAPSITAYLKDLV
jgi:phosphoheptose isomerase